jgi:hypothetical protein
MKPEIDNQNQCDHQIYKNKKFKSIEEFNAWIKNIGDYNIYFKDNGQDCQRWTIDKRGEVLDADMQSSVWNGSIVSLKDLKTNKGILILNRLPGGEGTVELDYIVDKISKI